ncbi:DUF423 domain-containing protein [Polaribacter tangerinus]|uniref:DUF423 domain-containing protein n=1 Tax=Polaribacter tangerinus TaxID=1920034 RepID=UPI000B4BE7D0|nr:DUF423 domain-containing protein [Polaribacter tangerinus]
MALIFGALFGLLSIIFGAFGAHLLKNKRTNELLQSFETGVRYQMFHAIVLLIIGYHIQFNNTIIQTLITYSFIVGVLLFSFSIYALVLIAPKHKYRKFLGPITPLGGLFLAIGWTLLLYKFIFN